MTATKSANDHRPNKCEDNNDKKFLVLVKSETKKQLLGRQ